MFVRFVCCLACGLSLTSYIIYQSIPVSRASPRRGPSRATVSTWFPKARVWGCSTSSPSPGARRTRSSASTRSCCTAHDCKQLKLLNNKLLSRFAWLTSTLQQLNLIILIDLSATLAPLRLVLTEDLPVSRFLVLWPCGMIAQHHHLLTT